MIVLSNSSGVVTHSARLRTGRHPSPSLSLPSEAIRRKYVGRSCVVPDSPRPGIAYGRIVFGNALIGVDGRDGGRDAIALARLLAGPNARFTLAHVAAGPVSWRERHVAEERGFDRAASMLAAERERAAIDAEIVCVEGTSPARGLHDLAKQREADLIVVGSTRHAFLGRVLLGDDARASLEGAPCAIAVAPHGYAERPSRLVEIGVGYDGSAEAEHALAVARELASRADTSIKALWVVSPEDVRQQEPIPPDLPVTAIRLVGYCSDRAGALHEVAGEAVYGEPATELSRFSSDVDLLVLAPRSNGPPRRSVHDSIPRHLVGHAACPLLVLAPTGVDVASFVCAA